MALLKKFVGKIFKFVQVDDSEVCLDFQSTTKETCPSIASHSIGRRKESMDIELEEEEEEGSLVESLAWNVGGKVDKE